MGEKRSIKIALNMCQINVKIIVMFLKIIFKMKLAYRDVIVSFEQINRLFLSND